MPKISPPDLPEPLAVWLLDEDVDDCQVALCVVVDLRLHVPGQGAVADALRVPPVGGAAVSRQVGRGLQGGAQMRVLGGQRQALVRLASAGKEGGKDILCKVFQRGKKTPHTLGHYLQSAAKIQGHYLQSAAKIQGHYLQSVAKIQGHYLQSVS